MMHYEPNEAKQTAMRKTQRDIRSQNQKKLDDHEKPK